MISKFLNLKWRNQYSAYFSFERKIGWRFGQNYKRNNLYILQQLWYLALFWSNSIFVWNSPSQNLMLFKTKLREVIFLFMWKSILNETSSEFKYQYLYINPKKATDEVPTCMKNSFFLFLIEFPSSFSTPVVYYISSLSSMPLT